MVRREPRLACTEAENREMARTGSCQRWRFLQTDHNSSSLKGLSSEVWIRPEPSRPG